MKIPAMLLVVGLAGALIMTACKKDENPADSGTGGGLSSSAFPGNQANLSPGGSAAVGALTGGTSPYSINTAPNAAIATAALSGANSDTLTIAPVGLGTTSVVIEDASTASIDGAAGQMLTISIVVAEGGGGSFAGSGTLSLTTSLGAFNASGTYNENAVSGQGVGGLRSTVEGDGVTAYDRLDVIAYVARSISDADIVFIGYQQEEALTTTTYPLLPVGGGYASVAFGFNVNLTDPTAAIYVGTMGNAALTSITATSAAGNNINGSGVNAQNPTMTATFSEGLFNVTGIGQGERPVGGTEIEQAVLRLYQRWRASKDAR